MLLGFAVLATLAWSLRRDRIGQRFPEPGEFTEQKKLIEQILIPIYVSFLLPVFCLCFGTASIAGDRDERTLAYLLVSPLPRPLIYTAKYCSALLLVLLWTLGGLAVLCSVAGEPGRDAFSALWSAVLLSSLAYVGLFHLFSVFFRRATIVALAYALFLETFMGNMPGIAKRLAVSFFTECLIFDEGSRFGFGPSGHHDAALYLPVSAGTAQTVLCLMAGSTFLLGVLLFARREYD